MEIISIGVLNGINNTYILTPVFKGCVHPVKIRITSKEFKKVKNSIDLMKNLAINKLS